MESFKITFYFQGGLRAFFFQNFISLDVANIQMHKIYSSKEMIRIIGGVIDTSKANGFSVTPAGPATTNNLLTWEMMKPNDEKC